MKNGYDQFFKNARKAAAEGEPVVKPSRQFSTSNVHFELSEEDLEKQLKLRMGMRASTKKKKKRKGIPWKLVGVSFLGLIIAAYGFQNYNQVERYVKRIEISFLGSAFAEEAKPTAKPEAAAAAKAGDAKAGDTKAADAAATKSEGQEVAKNDAALSEKSGTMTDDQIDHLSKLNDRKKELDEREEELNRMDQEVQAQKTELDKRMKELEEVRRGISSVLEDKVKVDDKKVDTLVQMYSDMKPPQAAKVFETMDEDLAVEILGRMKKKNAADIMNLLKPEKAQVLSEKFAGYKRK